ncbi:hypothetical protein JKF63_01768 [Porcisia hertigi]|uniref:Uncharacterized protein n=1 Tax=Porcisia hertigi TaxID=2761500 RepID=A0A836HIQ5_9TRYP|nr:hypothetical protein JKF63_01768 [Porcisia hertigi]
MKSIRQHGLRGGGDTATRAKRGFKAQRQAQRDRHSKYADTSSVAQPAVPLVPPTVQVLNRAPLEVFVQWNETAMEALRIGDTDFSRRILAALLPVLEARLHAMQCKASAHMPSTAVDSWRLAHALTLNNDGCQLRRDGRVDEALRQFLRAKQVETLVFGQPSCSTMLNLSAVLLSSGAAEEALVIAKECVMAAQDAEPVLFITALHNLAVALGQQSSERERNAALPTMRQALREAESVLGEQHPTTMMLKEKCVLTSRGSFLDSSAKNRGETEASERGGELGVGNEMTLESPTPESLSPKPLSAQERARAALHTLDFGEPAHYHQIAHNPIPPDAPHAAGPRVDSGGQKVHSSAVLNHSLGSAASGERRGTGGCPEGQDRPRSSAHTATQRDSVGDADSERGALVTGASSQSPAAHQLQFSRKLSSVAASVDHFCADSVHLSGTPVSDSRTPLETVLQEPFQVASLVISRSVPKYVGPAGPIRNLLDIDAEKAKDGHSFLRFGMPPPSLPANTTPLPLRKLPGPPVVQRPSYATAPPPRTKPQRARLPGNGSASDNDDDPYNNTVPELISTATPAAGERHTITKSGKSASAPGSSRTHQSAPQRSLFGKKGPLCSKSVASRELQLQEERAYRAEREAERQAAEAQMAFERELEKIQLRTKNRAAVTIQQAWRQWWNSVGRSRRQLQLHRLKELQRRRRERQALGVLANKVRGKSGGGKIPPPPSHQHGEVGGYVVPAVLLRCAKKWLAKTVCVRYLVKTRRTPVQAQLHEVDVRCHICRIQALWRGALVRSRLTQHHQHRLTGNFPIHTGRDTNMLRAASELRDYSALVLQMAYRSYRARCMWRELYLRRHNGPAAKIQLWFRVTLADQRRRGVDSRTVQQRNSAALTIQRVWRGFLGKVAFRIRELRLRMDRAGSYHPAIEAGVRARQTIPAIEYQKVRQRKRIPEATSSPPKTAPESTTELPDDANTADASAADKTTCGSQSGVGTIDTYAISCLQRSSEVQRLRDAERDQYHIGLFVETMATKERQAWQESLRLRPTEVLRRRVVLDTRIHEEQRAFTEHRAAAAIQRAYRSWQKMRHDPRRDTNLLYYSRAFYQQRQLGSLAERKQRRREIARVTARCGDSVAPMREERQKAGELLALVENCNGPASFSCGINGVIAVPRDDGVAIAPYRERMERKQQRQRQEAIQRRDEVLVAINHSHDMMHVRESPEECAARIGDRYEQPYYIPYVNDEHRRILGID